MSAAERSIPLTACLLRPCILAHLVGTSAYGYDLRHSLCAIGLECDLGTLYRALNTMEAEGLLSSTWERSEAGRSRRRYELTLAGADMLETYASSIGQLVAVAHAFVEMRTRAGGAPRSDVDDRHVDLVATANRGVNGQERLQMASRADPGVIATRVP